MSMSPLTTTISGRVDEAGRISTFDELPVVKHAVAPGSDVL